MNLLICTQAVDRENPALGFVPRWIEEFAKHFDTISVICLYEGKHTLPANVSVYSLGKEKGSASKLTYAIRFLRLLRKLRGTYDAVYVHMNTEYVFLGSAEWRIGGVRTALWYNHEIGGWNLKTAGRMVDIVMHTSPYAAPATFPNARRMPAGIDTEVFKPVPIARDEKSIYFQGRIAPAKRVHVLLEAVRLLGEKVSGVHVDLVGPHDDLYVRGLKESFNDLFASGVATLHGSVPNAETPKLYSSHAVSVNLTAAGNYDKSVLESIACGTPTVVSSQAFKDLIPEQLYCIENDSASLAATLEQVLALSLEERAALAEQGRKKVVEQHSLKRLGEEIRASLAS